MAGNSKFPDPKTSWKGKFMKEECSTSEIIQPPCLCTLGAASARIAAEQWKMCFFCQMMAWHWKVLLHNCGKNDAFTAPKRAKGRLTTIILQPYIFVRASVNGLLSTRKDPFLCIEFQRLWNYKLFWFSKSPILPEKAKKEVLRCKPRNLIFAIFFQNQK